ncbi:MAG TPA: hypothetical protein VN157_14725, partial [Caulobacter sp.]|nr:hypothetical protein [Caulobacter sp.]
LPDRGDGVLRRLDLAGLTVIEPLGPIDMQRLLAGCPPGAHRSRLPAEGGLCSSQALCHPARRPEWSETVDAGWNRLWTVDDYRRIVATIARFLAAAQNGSRAMTGVRR